ncbi:MAG: peroxide stress protein YaaA [Ilumatobacteraceae bacterium]
MSRQQFVVLLPPSEGKAEGGDRSAPWKPESGLFGDALGVWRRELAAELARIDGGNEKLLGVRAAHLDRARAANSSLVGAPTLPAWRRYTGVVWDHLDLPSLPATARNAALARIVVVSGIAGLVRADDRLPDYRLKMGARLPGYGALSGWWRDDLTEALARWLKGRTVIDLLPQEHRAAIDWSRLDAIRVDLVARSGGRVGGHDAKAAKGLLARHLLTGAGAVAPMVSSFRHDAYTTRIATA